MPSWPAQGKRYVLDRVTGVVDHVFSVDARERVDRDPGRHVVVDGLTASVAAGADRLAAAVPVARAIVEGRRAMGLAEKMGTLASRMKAVPEALGARADAVLMRIDALEAGGAATFSGLEQVVADAEAGVSAAEGALRQLTNG